MESIRIKCDKLGRGRWYFQIRFKSHRENPQQEKQQTWVGEIVYQDFKIHATKICGKKFKKNKNIIFFYRISRMYYKIL